jgi:hypothetical protein
VKFFREPDSAETVISRGPGDAKGFSFTVAPCAGIRCPEPICRGGRALGRKYVVRRRLPRARDDQYRLAGSFVMKNEPGPSRSRTATTSGRAFTSAPAGAAR